MDASGEHLSILRIAIYIVYPGHMIFNMQYKGSTPEHLLYLIYLFSVVLNIFY